MNSNTEALTFNEHHFKSLRIGHEKHPFESLIMEILNWYIEFHLQYYFRLLYIMWIWLKYIEKKNNSIFLFGSPKVNF